MRKKMKLICDGDDWYQETHMRLWWRPCLDLAGVWSQAVGFVFALLAGIWLQLP
jgi:hypothetical protein